MENIKEKTLEEVLKEISNILEENNVTFSQVVVGKRTGAKSPALDYIPDTHELTLELVKQ